MADQPERARRRRRSPVPDDARAMAQIRAALEPFRNDADAVRRIVTAALILIGSDIVEIQKPRTAAEKEAHDTQ